jgi:hypothetical protein
MNGRNQTTSCGTQLCAWPPMVFTMKSARRATTTSLK